MVQSKHWTDVDGMVFVTRDDGTHFRTNPSNIGVESELYTRFGDGDTKDTSIEEWFAAEVDGPAKAMIEHLLDPGNVRRIPFRGDEAKAEVLRTLGFKVNPYVDLVVLPMRIRLAIARYLSALLVRHPIYLSKLTEFHQDKQVPDSEAKERALANMIHLYNVYAEAISRSMITISRRVEAYEYLYGDGGLVVQEPWRRADGIPFDIHAPVTPDIALQVLPLPIKTDLNAAPVSEVTDNGVIRQNRIVLGGTRRFVFSRSAPPAEFIANNFGKPAPKNIGYRFVDGRLETRFDPSRN